MEENNAQANSPSVESHKKVKSYFGETYVKTEESVYTWTIKNLSHCYMKDATIESPSFTTELKDDNLEWNLTFYPDGKEDAEDGYASLQLNKIDYDNSIVYIKFSTLAQIEGCLQEEVQHESYVAFTDLDDEDYSIDEFMKMENLNRFLHNGNLTIRCRFYAHLGTSASEVNESSITRVEKPAAVDHRLRELEDFGDLFENEKFSDVSLVVGEETFVAHKVVLSARSRVFAAMFEHNMKENKENLVNVVDVESKVMREVLRFIYSAKVENLEPLTEGLLAAADMYELNGLKIMCEEALMEKLSDKTVGNILLLADRYDAEKLRTATLEFITIHANELASVESFNEAIKSLSPLLSTIIKTLMLKM